MISKKQLLQESIQESKSDYAQTWESTSKGYFDNGYYARFSQKIPEDSNVLEIGAGTGYSTLSILDRTSNYLGIEMNNFCLLELEKKLNQANFDFDIHYRSKLDIDENFFYKFSWGSFQIDIKNKPVLIEGDINSDHLLLKNLTKYKFDVVVCWMLGYFKLYNETDKHQSVVKNAQRSPDDTRRIKYNIQSRVSEISKKALSKRGFIYVVERFDERILNAATKKAFIGLTEEIFENFNVVEFECFEGKNNSTLQMINDTGEPIKPKILFYCMLKLCRDD